MFQQEKTPNFSGMKQINKHPRSPRKEKRGGGEGERGWWTALDNKVK